MCSFIRNGASPTSIRSKTSIDCWGLAGNRSAQPVHHIMMGTPLLSCSLHTKEKYVFPGRFLLHPFVQLAPHYCRYVGRTFIMPGQAFRRQNVRKKLSAVSCVLEGRSVLLVDDSIVRGTTSREIVKIVREAGARKVYFCSASPPVSL